MRTLFSNLGEGEQSSEGKGHRTTHDDLIVGAQPRLRARTSPNDGMPRVSESPCHQTGADA